MGRFFTGNYLYFKWLGGHSLFQKNREWRKKRQDFSAFALTYILRLSSCRVMGDFVISPLVPRKKSIQC